jgi:hypothetical protein
VLIAAGFMDEEHYVYALARSLGLEYETFDGRERTCCSLNDERLLSAAKVGLLPLIIGGEEVFVLAPHPARQFIELVARYPRTRFRLTSSARLGLEADLRCAYAHTARPLERTWPDGVHDLSTNGGRQRACRHYPSGASRQLRLCRRDRLSDPHRGWPPDCVDVSVRDQPDRGLCDFNQPWRTGARTARAAYTCLGTGSGTSTLAASVGGGLARSVPACARSAGLGKDRTRAREELATRSDEECDHARCCSLRRAAPKLRSAA